MTDRHGESDDPDEAFHRIVEGLDLDLDFPDEGSGASARAATAHEEVVHVEETDFDDLPDEAFYRDVGPTSLRPRDRRTVLAWYAVGGGPLILVLCTLARVRLPTTVAWSIMIVFAAGVIWLISRLPSHGPGRRDWPDDGAVL